MKELQPILYALLPVLTVAYAWTTCYLSPSFVTHARRDAARFLASSLCLCVLFGLEVAVRIRLPLLYLALWCVLAPVLYRRKLGSISSFLHINIHFICLAAEHLAALGVLALATRQNVMRLLAEPLWRCAGLLAALALNIATNLMTRRSGIVDQAQKGGAERQEAAMLSVFAWFCTGFTLLQSVPCLYDLPVVLTSLFLIGSNLLMLMLLYLFSSHATSILRNRYWEEEHLRLERERRDAERRKSELAEYVFTDRLTKAATRRRVQEAMDDMARGGVPFAVVFLDLDRLKEINDRDGHAQGDAYLTAFSRRFQARLRPGDLFARVGGDEFVVLIPGCGAEEARRRVGDIQAALSVGGGGERAVPFSFGASAWTPASRLTPEEVLTQADRAMYENKTRRRAGACPGRGDPSQSGGDQQPWTRP